MNIYSGPATLVEIDDDVGMAGKSSLGEAAEITINWEPQGAELMDKSKTQNGGIGTLEMKLMEGGSTNKGILQGFRNTRTWILITTASGTTFKVLNVYLSYGYAGNLSDQNDTIGFPVSTTKWTDEPDDFVVIPTDS